jgi:hypothetical protein
MSKSGMREQIEYQAWFIRHSGKLVLGSLFVPGILLFLLGFIISIPGPGRPFAALGFVFVMAVVTPIFYLFCTALFLRWFHRRERTIKIASIIVYFVLLVSQVWLVPELVKRGWLPVEEGAAPPNGVHRQSEPTRSDSE